MSKAIRIRLRDETYRDLKRRAQASSRTISNLVVTAALRYAREAKARTGRLLG